VVLVAVGVVLGEDVKGFVLAVLGDEESRGFRDP
jgi:DNA-binding ferritin-like protein (Dps family)